MPMSSGFEQRITPKILKIADHFGTPFHIYDEEGIRETGKNLIKAFSKVKGFKEFFAVKALPNPAIMSIMRKLGFGFDCSSIPEIYLSRQAGCTGSDLMFTSNNTTIEEFDNALSDGGCILNLDDISLISKVPEMPELICFRYNPGDRRKGNDIIGNPVEAKYGISHDQVIEAYSQAMDRGAKRFGIHTMLASNELNYKYMVKTTEMLLGLVEKINRELSVSVEFINIGGGLGIPYRPEDRPLDIVSLGSEISQLLSGFSHKNGYCPKFFIESGRYITGPHGILVVKAINFKNIYRRYVGVDACMSSLMRPAIYGAYHHITVPGRKNEKRDMVDIVGSLCENNDKFAVQRNLPVLKEGDLLFIHDTGAHGSAMGFNYNGRLRPKELLLRRDGTVELIRRQETMDDYLSTLNFHKNILK